MAKRTEKSKKRKSVKYVPTDAFVENLLDLTATAMVRNVELDRNVKSLGERIVQLEADLRLAQSQTKHYVMRTNTLMKVVLGGKLKRWFTYNLGRLSKAYRTGYHKRTSLWQWGLARFVHEVRVEK